MSVEYASNGTTIQEANITTTNNLRAFLQLRRNIWVNTSLCNSIGIVQPLRRCSPLTLLPLFPLRTLSSGTMSNEVWLQVLLLCSTSRTVTNGVRRCGYDCSTADGWKERQPLAHLSNRYASVLQTSGQPSHVSQQTMLETLDHVIVCCLQGRYSPGNQFLEFAD